MNFNPGMPDVSAYSRFVQRIRRRYIAEYALLAPGEPRRTSMENALAALRARDMSTGAALRVLRQLVIERLVVLDCEGPPAEQAALGVVTCAMTELAELALDLAMQESRVALDAQYGAPQTDTGMPAQMWVIGMGKLGARELNVSSDIDLIYIYDQDGHTAGRPGEIGRAHV